MWFPADVDEGGSRKVGNTPSMFYLPHCEAKLCNALLEANWDASQLSNVRCKSITGSCDT